MKPRDPWERLNPDEAKRVDVAGRFDFFWVVLEAGMPGLMLRLPSLPQPLPRLPKLKTFLHPSDLYRVDRHSFLASRNEVRSRYSKPFAGMSLRPERQVRIATRRSSERCSVHGDGITFCVAERPMGCPLKNSGGLSANWPSFGTLCPHSAQRLQLRLGPAQPARRRTSSSSGAASR